ncbi:unnamed protein product, partial [Ectocarpus sp. 12 AP-2014]
RPWFSFGRLCHRLICECMEQARYFVLGSRGTNHLRAAVEKCWPLRLVFPLPAPGQSCARRNRPVPFETRSSHVQCFCALSPPADVLCRCFSAFGFDLFFRSKSTARNCSAEAGNKDIETAFVDLGI